MFRKTLSLLLFLTLSATAKIVEYDLTIASEIVAPAGRNVRGLTINGGIPGPTLRFHVGDTARIRVHNRLPREETSTHWHGLLLPNAQDGISRVTTPPILAGQSHTFEFPLTHAGTYWYHSHTGLQEQRGVFGAIVVLPEGASAAANDHVLLLSDWTNENPDNVMKTLMRGSDWYGIKKGTAQSIVGAIRAGELPAYLKREWARLPPMDVSDVGYDAFLINGRRSIELPGKPGTTMRLRLINAGASTYFYTESSTGPMSIVANDGMDVRPIRQKRLLVGNGETYDVLVTIPRTGRWEFRATPQDVSGHASAFFGTGELHPAEGPPRLNPYNMNASLGSVLDQLDETGMLTDAAALAQERAAPLPPYKRLRATHNTAIPNANPRTIRLHLTGDMMRYIWTINGKTVTEETVIPVKRGEVIRFELINDTMMHHPMHLHGHFFRLLMDPANPPANAPLKHTVDVPPMSRRTIEFLANEKRDWLFHCHILYHMHAGMTRVVSYGDGLRPRELKLALSDHNHPMLMLDASIETHMSMGHLMLQNARNDLGLRWHAGWGHDKTGEPVVHDGGPVHTHPLPDVEYDVDVMWHRYINPKWSVFGGYRFTNMHDERDRWVAGFMHMLPGMIDATVSADSEGAVRFELEKKFQITARLGAFGHVEYDTHTEWDWRAGVTYTLDRNFSLISSYDKDHGFGAGLEFRF
jgi:FtsP/CotA-like multicopper oxidase with cupredoxin domain